LPLGGPPALEVGGASEEFGVLDGGMAEGVLDGVGLDEEVGGKSPGVEDGGVVLLVLEPGEVAPWAAVLLPGGPPPP
jgi:hypothetical protein